MAKPSMLTLAKEYFDLDDMERAKITAVIALAEQTKRVADAAWKKLGQENKAEKE